MTLLPIDDIAVRVGIPSSALYHYGPHKAKLTREFTESLPRETRGKLILVTAISPTPAEIGRAHV